MPAAAKETLWYKDAIIYELHVKAYKDSNADGTGDFRGLIEKLDYVQQLGVTAIWLLPFYPSPFKDDGYDIADYRGIHPAYGSLRDFRQFVREAHRRNIRVITELVINHTSDQHPWFQAARRGKANSIRRKYYVWSDTDKKFPETRIIFTDTETSNWTWDQTAKAYYWHRFFSHQPDLNHNNPRVVKAVLKVMRFWLDMGVDGLRLDAVPYLCVRDGTNNENLPETHQVLKEFRRYLDKNYTDRMFLAEANQWPEDVRPYFGDGDECHMAFHFPLMPRMFMALRQEDRHPITEILDRTPAIPSNCQWALFLRNHDELTLEMVTDAERDYMYREYARDSRMKLNVGIRRRLAPLLDNSRRRIELLNSLLFSMPGSPVIYYGDEMGMGDNIFLGDRDGVRTPMQWNLDRNAGFSKADPARLYLPPIMDPVYGYQAVNVEAQERDPSSLLHFMRRLIALRRQHKAFGRGTIEFLRPDNRSVLAYVRRYRSEIILIIANLSRFVQPAELDLSEFSDRIPVEMIGRTEFPRIGDLPYFITLGPHSFYWFRLEPQAEPIMVAPRSEAEAAPAVPQLNLENLWSTLLEPEYLYTLANDVLQPYFRMQRWFRGKAKNISSCRLLDWAKLGASFFLTLVEVAYETNEQETYVMPLKIVLGKPARALAEKIPDSVAATVKNWRGEGVLYDALMDRAAGEIFFTAIGDGRKYKTAQGGRIQTLPTSAYDANAIQETSDRIRKLGAEQSNTSIIIDDTFILKVFRKMETGANPDVEMSLFLTEQTGFTGIAPVLGTVRYEDPGGGSATIAMLQQYIPNQGDGWTYTLDSLREYYRKVAEQAAAGVAPPEFEGLTAGEGGAEIPQPLADMAGPYLQAVEMLGRRTAEFHLALAGNRRNPDFRPVKPTDATSEMYAETISREIKESMTRLGSILDALTPECRKRADLLLKEGTGLLSRVHAMADIGPDLGMLIRVHGDYHLGQVLRTDDDFILLDFEGEPLRPLEERRRKRPALKDVAGMLRSFHYAAHTGFLAAAEETKLEPAELAGWRQVWFDGVSAVFLHAYLETAGVAAFLPKENLELVLEVFTLEKVFYELQYELDNRPDWLHVPLEGIFEIIAKQKKSRRKK